MMMGLSLCSPMVVSTSSVKSLPAPASPMSTVGFTCKQDCREAHDPQSCERRLQDDLTDGLAAQYVMLHACVRRSMAVSKVSAQRVWEASAVCNGAVGAERARHPLDGGCERLPLDIRLGLSGKGLHSGAQLLLALHSDQAVRIQDPEIRGGLLICQALQTRPP